jgi:hypothetical protein
VLLLRGALRARLAIGEGSHDQGVLHEPFVAFIVRRRVSERLEVVAESVGEPVDEELSLVERGEGRDRLRDREGMRVHRSYRDEG